MYHILIVDDEQNVLNALRRELQGEFLVETFSSPVEALQHSRQTQFDLVIADYKMPEMNGVEFLMQFSKLQPDAMRLVLSGEADFDALASSVNETHIYRFIAKPWDKGELVVTVVQALSHRVMLLENRRLAEQCRKERHWQRAQDPDKLYQVLLVDDEPNVLSAATRDLTSRERLDDLHAAMRHADAPDIPVERHDFHFKVHTSTSPLQALESAKQVSFDVVISDYLMPEMDGLQFLDAFRRLQPDAVRILFSGHADKEVLIKAINDSEIYGYIEKPWSQYVLKNTVSQGIAYRNLLRENRRLADLMSH